MKCPVIERWRNQGILAKMPTKKLLKHWRKCKICQKRFKEIKKMIELSQWKYVGICRFCRSPIFEKDDGELKYSGPLECNCELEREEETNEAT